MLKTTKSISLSGQSYVGDALAMSFTAKIGNDNGHSTITASTINQELYDTNKKEVRQDLAAFNDAVYDVQDKMAVSDDKDASNETTESTEPAAEPGDGTNGVTPEAEKTE
ncbi:hypothetical protein [Loigolactobacillus bifermentans]|uniref:Uncharacterized protein n=1 Tax=Loigolactobacillus bifermentans DSM 20003 TaxID=1423726 RepID=A0A0R1GY00_9LACO|nr:hypothetical protein [Loigolactobacillus bifermentans]KRK38975.1 hypothetical protein FC07_GL002691 [Loigolactobacillus bifermentans DSM 20003]